MRFPRGSAPLGLIAFHVEGGPTMSIRMRTALVALVVTLAGSPARATPFAYMVGSMNNINVIPGLRLQRPGTHERLPNDSGVIDRSTWGCSNDNREGCHQLNREDPGDDE